MWILQHHCKGESHQIQFKYKLEKPPRPVLLYIKGQLIWATHGGVITSRVQHDFQKMWKIPQKYENIATSFSKPESTNSV